MFHFQPTQTSESWNLLRFAGAHGYLSMPKWLKMEMA